MTDPLGDLSPYERQLAERVDRAAAAPAERAGVREELLDVLGLAVRDVGDQEQVVPGALLAVLRRNSHWLQLGDLLPQELAEPDGQAPAGSE